MGGYFRHILDIIFIYLTEKVSGTILELFFSDTIFMYQIGGFGIRFLVFM